MPPPHGHHHGHHHHHHHHRRRGFGWGFPPVVAISMPGPPSCQQERRMTGAGMFGGAMVGAVLGGPIGLVIGAATGAATGAAVAASTHRNQQTVPPPPSQPQAQPMAPAMPTQMRTPLPSAPSSTTATTSNEFIAPLAQSVMSNQPSSLPVAVGRLELWVVEPFKQEFDSFFIAFDPIQGKLHKPKVMEALSSMDMTDASVMSRLFDLSDVDGDGLLDSDEFAVCMYLGKQYLEAGGAKILPPEGQGLPEYLVPPNKRKAFVAS